jgi:hypothetical protein
MIIEMLPLLIKISFYAAQILHSIQDMKYKSQKPTTKLLFTLSESWHYSYRRMREPLCKPFHCLCRCAVEWVLLLELALRWDHLIPLTWFEAHVGQLHSRAQAKSWGL